MKTIDGNKETFYQLTTSEWLTLCNQLNLSFAAMKVLMYLRTINPWGDRKVEAETKDLAKALNLNIRTVQRCLHELDDKKLIELEFNRFKFTLKSHVATSTSPSDQNVATSTSPSDQNVATSTSFEGRECRSGDVHVAKATGMSRSQSESTDAQGFQEPSYSSYSSDFKDSLSLFKEYEEGEREIFANASKSQEGEQEVQSTEPELPKQNPTLINKTQTVEGQYSGAAPPKIFGINRWADFVGPGPVPGFWESAVRKANELPERPMDAEMVAQAMIRNHGHLMWPKYQAAEAKRQAAEAALAAQTIAEAQPEEPREMPLDAIARIMQAQGLTPADVLPEVKSEYRAVFSRLPSDPQEAWDLLSRAQLSIVATFLEKKYATP